MGAAHLARPAFAGQRKDLRGAGLVTGGEGHMSEAVKFIRSGGAVLLYHALLGER